MPALELDLRDPAQPAPAGGGAVVADLFRATATLHALVECGHDVELVTTAEQASERVAAGRRCVGEWRGYRQPGFVCGNSPRAARRLVPDGAPVVFLSSNGAGAITFAARWHEPVLLACLANLPAVAARVGAVGGRWTLVPAGHRSGPRIEDDVVCARLADLLPGARRGPGLTERGRRVAGVTTAQLWGSPSAQWLLEHDPGGRADIHPVLDAAPSAVLPVYRDGLVRAAVEGRP